MSHLAMRSRPASSIPTSSMADVAFLLLVFFLVTTVFPKDRGLALVLPDEPGPVSPSNVLTLVVIPDGRVDVRAGNSPIGRLVDADEVGAIWRDAVAANPRLIAAVQTDAAASYGRMVDVLDQLQGAGARRIALQLRER